MHIFVAPAPKSTLTKRIYVDGSPGGNIQAFRNIVLAQ
jgi:hypothetical protein